MLSRLSIVLAVSILSLSTACSFGDGTAESCQTAMTGTFTGTQEGPIFSNLTVDPESMALTLEVTFLFPDETTPDDPTDFQPRSNTLLVSEDGTVMADGGILEVADTVMDLDTCDITGTWIFFAETGEFTLGPYHSL
jgi:hypothetical protein